MNYLANGIPLTSIYVTLLIYCVSIFSLYSLNRKVNQKESKKKKKNKKIKTPNTAKEKLIQKNSCGK